MTFRTAFTLVIFVAFVGLCGFELAGHITIAAGRDMESVRYVRSIDAPAKEQTKAKTFDLNQILEDTNVDG